MAKQATIDDLLGKVCILKERMPYDTCRDCTGRSTYALFTECPHYVTRSNKIDILKRIKQAVREYNSHSNLPNLSNLPKDI